ncbi:hypothetical protein GCM10022216_14640 [Sphingobacterium kyonggiense]|uniref:Lysophospholipase L1-like esterase n=1 Tax=Sphingobacterium kyonggiense TaxID=714075 RepID=A0ABP7YLJ5_9SPHI
MDPNINQLAEITDFENAKIIGKEPHEDKYREASFPKVLSWMQSKLDINGAELIDPPEPGTLEAPTALPLPPAGQKRKFEPQPGYYSFDGANYIVTSENRYYFFWNGTAWSLLDMGPLKKGDNGLNGKTIEQFKPTKPSGYAAGDQIFFNGDAIYEVNAGQTATTGESPSTNPEKFTRKIRGLNLSSMESATLEVVKDMADLVNLTFQGYLNNVGTFAASTGWKTTDFISKSDWQKIIYSGRGSTNVSARLLVAYKSDKSMLSTLVDNSSTQITDREIDLSSVPSDGFIRACFRDVYESKLILKKDGLIVDKQPMAKASEFDENNNEDGVTAFQVADYLKTNGSKGFSPWEAKEYNIGSKVSYDNSLFEAISPALPSDVPFFGSEVWKRELRGLSLSKQTFIEEIIADSVDDLLGGNISLAGDYSPTVTGWGSTDLFQKNGAQKMFYTGGASGGSSTQQVYWYKSDGSKGGSLLQGGLTKTWTDHEIDLSVVPENGSIRACSRTTVAVKIVLQKDGVTQDLYPAIKATSFDPLNTEEAVTAKQVADYVSAMPDGKHNLTNMEVVWCGHSIWALPDNITLKGNQFRIKEEVQFKADYNYCWAGYSLARQTTTDENSLLDPTRLATMPIGDIYTLDTMTNDFKRNIPIGDFKIDFIDASSNPDVTKYYGALRAFYNKIYSLNPKALVIASNATHRNNDYNSWTINTKGHTLADYTSALKNVCNYLSWKFIDQFSESGINMINLSQFTSDGLHLNNNGYLLTSPLWVSKFKLIRNLIQS